MTARIESTEYSHAYAAIHGPDLISLTDPDSRSMATSGRGSGVVGYNVQTVVETESHLIIAHEVTNSGSDRAQLANMGRQAKAVLGVEKLEAVADRGYYNSPEFCACEEAGITVTLPKPMTSGSKSAGRFGKQDFVYVAEHDAYRCPAGKWLTYRFTREEDGKAMRRYWTNACVACPLQKKCTTGPERRISRWEHEHVLEAVQERLDADPQAMRSRRKTVEHPFGTIKARMGATHFLMKTLPRVASGNGVARARLQSDAGHEHRRHQAVAGRDQGLRAELRLTSPLWHRPRTAVVGKSSKMAALRTSIGGRSLLQPAGPRPAAFSHNQDPKANSTISRTRSAERSGSKSVGPNAMNFIAGPQSSSDPVDETSLKRIEALFESRAILHLHGARGHPGKQSQAPKQVLGVVTLHATCEE